MKKFFGWMLVVMLVISACGKDGKDTVFLVLDIDVPSHTNSWRMVRDEITEDFLFFECRVPVREITGDIFDNGAVLCYLVEYVGYGNTTIPIQSPLPYTLFRVDYEDNEYYFSENYTFEVSPGYINFVVKVSDFWDGEYPLNCTFRVVIMR